MGVDLSGGPSLNWAGWRFCLDVALRNGWQPEGTRAPDLVFYGPDGSVREERVPDDEWNGGYCSNDGQWVTDSDARNLAAALDRAIALRHKLGLDEDNCCVLAEVADTARLGGFIIF